MTPAISPDILLMTWLSPAFPIGGFAYSHGLEWATEAGDVSNLASLTQWLSDLVARGGVRNDCILLAESFRAIGREDFDGLQEVNALALALSPTRERLLETVQQGGSFMDAIAAAWPAPSITLARKTLPGDIAYPVALGLSAAAHGLPLERTCTAFALSFIAAQISSAVRLSVIGQTDAQRALAALSADITTLAAFAAGSTLNDLGAAAFRSDIASMKHETQYSRLFRS